MSKKKPPYGIPDLISAKAILATQELSRAERFFRKLLDMGEFGTDSHDYAKEVLDRMAMTLKTLESKSQKEIEFRLMQGDEK